MVYMLLVPPGALPSYIALGAFVWRRRRRIQNQVIKAAMAPRTTTPPTAPPTIAPVLDFEDEEGEGDCVPALPLDVIEAGSAEDVTAVAVAWALVAVDSGVSPVS